MILYLACLLTVIIEFIFFCLRGYRDRDFLIACVAVNVITNLTLNLILSRTAFLHSTPAYIILELLIVTIEFGIYCFIEKPSGKLFFNTLLANTASLTLGGVLLRLVYA